MLGATVDRAREHTSHRNPIRSLYWRSKARSPHWASVAAIPPGHCPVLALAAQEAVGCSRRIGSVQKDTAVRAVAPGGTRRSAPRATAALTSQDRAYEVQDAGNRHVRICEGCALQVRSTQPPEMAAAAK